MAQGQRPERWFPREGGAGPGRGSLDQRAQTHPGGFGASGRRLSPGSVFAAKKLSLYQVLAPNAFSPVEAFVPILQKTVSSTVHEVTRARSSPAGRGGAARGGGPLPADTQEVRVPGSARGCAERRAPVKVFLHPIRNAPPSVLTAPRAHFRHSGMTVWTEPRLAMGL